MSFTRGLVWSSGAPGWAAEPDLLSIESIARAHLNVPHDEKCIVTFSIAGARNKVYKVETAGRACIMRVALPLDPEKVACEVASMDCVRQETTIPVPAVIAYDTTSNSILGFPWILMELAPGQSLRGVWRHMSIERKRQIVSQIADIQIQLSGMRFRGIGGLSISAGGDFAIGRLMDGGYATYGGDTDATLGPHLNSTEWLRSRLAALYLNLDQTPDALPDDLPESERQRVMSELSDARIQADAISTFLPGCYSTSSSEITTLYHNDLHPGNIFVDESDRITAVLDWEFLGVVPDWMASSLPKLLRSRKRQLEPRQSFYGDPEDYLDEEEVRDCRGISVCYWMDLEEYEATLLRPFYLEELERLSPGARERHEATKFHRLLEDQIGRLEIGRPVCYLPDLLAAYKGDGRVPVHETLEWPFLDEDRRVDYVESDEEAVDEHVDDRSDCNTTAAAALSAEDNGLVISEATGAEAEEGQGMEPDVAESQRDEAGGPTGGREEATVGVRLGPLASVRSFFNFYFYLSD